MLEKVQFQTNVPVEVALKFDPPGKIVEGNYGDQVYYTVVDGTAEKSAYLPPIVDQRIQDLRIRKGERFTITKAEVKSGTRRGIEWQVRRVDPARTGNEQPAAAPGQEPRPASSEHSLKHSTDSSAPRPVTRIEDALRTVIHAVAQAEAYARDLNRPVVFSAEDIRLMTNTLLINQSREAGAR